MLLLIERCSLIVLAPPHLLAILGLKALFQVLQGFLKDVVGTGLSQPDTMTCTTEGAL
jgi:hypothetical protein